MSKHKALYKNFPLSEVIPACDRIIKDGGTVFQKWTCSGCGQRITAKQANTLTGHGHCEDCGAITDIEKAGCNYSMMFSIGRQEAKSDVGPSEEKFNVYVYLGPQLLEEQVRDHVTLEQAIEAAALHAQQTVAAKTGIVQRVIVTDDGDHCVFEWLRDKGVTWPTEQMRAERRAHQFPMPPLRQ
jgi:hypothetical protein